MTKWGVGPRLFISCLIPAVLSLALSYRLSPFFEYPLLTDAMRTITAIVLITLGSVFWISSIIAVMTAFKAHRLCTTGPFALCRHPVYASWILFILPGISLLINSWLLLTAPLVMYWVLCSNVSKEDRYLEEYFGMDYESYRERVPAVIPLGWLKRSGKSQ